MQFSEFEYQQSAQQPFRRRVQFGWIIEAWGIYRQGFAPWLILNLVIGCPLILTVLAFAVVIHSPDTSSASGSSSGSDSGLDPSMIAFAIFFAGGWLLALFFMAFLVVCCSSGLALRQVRGETVRPSEIFQGMNRWIATTVLCLILVPTLIASTLVLGVGLFAACGLLMPAFALVADGQSGLQAFSKSFGAMKKDWSQAGLFCFVLTLVSVLGSVLTLGIGTLVFLPMMYIISALAYRDVIETGNDRNEFDRIDQHVDGVWPPAPTPLLAPSFEQNRAVDPDDPYGSGPGRY